MACLENVRIKQTVTYNSTPDTINGLLNGNVLLEIFNTYGNPISGEITIDKIRELPVVDIDDEPITETQSITSTGDTFNFNFYYPSNEPKNIVIGVKVKIRVLDCFYEASCSHILLTPNPDEDFSYCDKFVQGYDVISGCTDSAYYEYNPSANFDDGSCLNLKPVFGCTNSLAANYNPLATFNDGSCVFSSGCTNPIAVNYDSSAVIDDGSCECGDVNIRLDFDLASGESYVIEADCEYLLEFNLLTEINCGKLIDYLVDNPKTILEVLEELKINVQTFVLTDEEGLILDYTGGTLEYSGTTDTLLIQSENVYSFDRTVQPYGIGLYGETEDCNFVNQLISAELGIDCPTETELSNRFLNSWKKYSYVLNSDLIGTFIRMGLNFAEFNFGLCTYIDNVKLSKTCTKKQDRCVIIPSKYGFELDKVVDNKKSWVYSEEKTDRLYEFPTQETDYVDYNSKLTFNTKEIELTVNPVKYIESDVLSYYDYYSKFFTAIDSRYALLDADYIKYQSIDPIGRQHIRQYPFLNTIYEQYLDGLDCAPTKALDYPYGLEIIDKTGNYWYTAVKQVMHATTIWNGAQFTLKNNAFHKPKFAYKRYTIGGPSETEVPCTTSIVSPTSNFLSVVFWSKSESSGTLLQSVDFTDGDTIITVNPTDRDMIPDGVLFAADLQTWLDSNGGGTVTWLTAGQFIPNVFVPTVLGFYLVVQSNTQILSTVYYDTGGEPIANNADTSCTNSYTIDSSSQYITSLTINGTEIVPVDTLWDMSTIEGVTTAQIAINSFITGLAYVITDIYYLFISLPNCEEIVLTTINNCPDNMPTIECNVLSDSCYSEAFSNIDNLLTFDFGNIQCTSIYTGGTFGYSGTNGDGYFLGKIVQYSTNENGYNNIENTIGFDDSSCISGEPIACESVTILPNLSYECITVDGINTGFATVTVAPTGGQGPYTVANAFDPDAFVIIAEGDSYSNSDLDGVVISIIVTDANGCIAAPELSTVTVDCPIDVNNCTPIIDYTCSGETNFATLQISSVGGTAPYTYYITNNDVEITEDEVVENGDVIYVLITDSNGCTGDTSITIVCPIDLGLTCQDVADALTINIRTAINKMSSYPSLPVGAHATDCDVNSTVTGLGALGLSYSDIISIEYTVEDITPTLINLSDFPPFPTSNPFIFTRPNPNSTADISAVYSGICSGTMTANYNVLVKYTIQYGALTCEICGTANVNANYDCSGFKTATLTPLTLTVC